MAKKKRRKNRKRRKKSILRWLGSFLAVCFLLSCIALAAGVYYIVETAEEIDTSNVYSQIDQTSYIYDKDGELLDTLHYEEDRKIVESENIPENLKHAVIAIEDKTFYQHHGFNFKRMAGAVLNKLLRRSNSISGTSTITQQLARNVYLSDIKSERTFQRKATEMYYAYQLERSLTKDAILEAYLNTIYLGYGCYGVNSAAKTYFSKDVSELALSECAALAALPQAPDQYALLRDEEGDYTTYLDGPDVYANDASKERRDLVLDLMASQGYISQTEADEAKVDIASILDPDLSKPASSYTYFVDFVASELAKDLVSEHGMTEGEADRLVHTGGLQIYSTLDADAQKIINSEFKDDDHFPSCIDGETEPQASMVITEVGTGKIIAMSGGRNGKGQKLFNRAVSPRQPGSSIKPLAVYSAALQKSFDLQKDGKEYDYIETGYDKQGAKYWGSYITASSYVADEKMIVNGNVWPKNASGTYSGRRTFRTALQQSINTCAVKIQVQVGSDYSIKMLKKYGISTLVDDITQSSNDVNPAALALGAMTYGATPLDMALAYGAFPGGGDRCKAVCYTSVEDSNGNTILEKEPKKIAVMNEGVAWIMTDVLKSAVSKGIAYNAAISGTEVGGKTGTTNDAYDIWFCGFTPKYTAALWIGTDKNVEMNTTSATAAALWSKIMSQVPGATDGEYAEQPSNIVYKNGEYYTSGTEVGTVYIAPKKKKSDSDSNSSSSGSESQSRSSGSNGGSSSNPSSSREEFVRDFVDGGSGGSSNSSGNRSSKRSGGESSSRDEFVRNWENSN